MLLTFYLNSLLLCIVLAELKLIKFIIKQLINYIINLLLLTQFTSLLLIAITRNSILFLCNMLLIMYNVTYNIHTNVRLLNAVRTSV